jgi:hypothetical protein
LEEHDLRDIDKEFGQLNGRLSSVVMAMYLGANNLRHLMPHNWNEFKPLVDAINNTCNGLTIKRSWFNILPSNTDLAAHTHLKSKERGATFGTFVYYPKLVENDVPLELLTNNEWVTVPTKTGDWVCFDLECTHRVPLNNASHHRISFAFDI